MFNRLTTTATIYIYIYFLTLLLSSFWTSRGHRCRPFCPPVLAFSFYRAQGSVISLLVDFHRVLLTHALALSASQFVHKKESLRNFTSMHSAGLELTKLTYTRLEDNLICHRGDRSIYVYLVCIFSACHTHQHELQHRSLNNKHLRNMYGSLPPRPSDPCFVGTIEMPHFCRLRVVARGAQPKKLISI